MHLNLPIIEQLADCENILIAGMGGGFDVFCGLPIYFELEKLEKDVHLANLSFSDITEVFNGEELTDTLIGITVDAEGDADYFPEFYLAEWFYSERNEDVVIWGFQKTGARPLVRNYQALVEHLNIDGIILVDGGVDSLIHGDEPQAGTIFEDMLSLLAVNELKKVPVKINACLGLGVEHEIGYAHLFENIAELSKAGSFLGTCSLLKQMEVYQQYEAAVKYVFDQQPEYPSVISSSVISAVQGHYGNYHLIKRTRGSRLRISPLMSIYWFFDTQAVVKRNLLIPHLRLTYTIEEAWNAMNKARNSLSLRDTPVYPLH